MGSILHWRQGDSFDQRAGDNTLGYDDLGRLSSRALTSGASGPTLSSGYTPVANVAVRAYVQGTGAPQWMASAISNTYTFFKSSTEPLLSRRSLEIWVSFWLLERRATHVNHQYPRPLIGQFHEAPRRRVHSR